MPFMNDAVYDAALQVFVDDGNQLHLCSQEPGTFTEATATYSLASKASPTITAQADHTSGRKVEVSPFSA